jgi:hypothetical protein
MTPKAKAVELFNDYYSYLKANLMYDEEAMQDAKQCALIAVDEILFILNECEDTYSDNASQFYQEVKQEIELL